MLSKILRPSVRQLVAVRAATALCVSRRVIGTLVPRSQYYTPIGKNLSIGYAMRVHWEIIPLVVTTVFALFLVAYAIVWACKHKVDVVFTTHSMDNISRTMDLRNPECHKMLTINQRYEPWDEMADVLEKMIFAHRRAQVREMACSHP